MHNFFDGIDCPFRPLLVWSEAVFVLTLALALALALEFCQLLYAGAATDIAAPEYAGHEVGKTVNFDALSRQEKRELAQRLMYGWQFYCAK